MWEVVSALLGYLFWLILLVGVLSPYLSRKAIEGARLRLISLIERKYNHRVITLIHRQERVGLFGIPIHRYIDIEDSEAVIRAIRTTPPDKPIMLIIHTPGGLVLAASQIARALKAHPAKKVVVVPHYAMSGGALIALAADEIVMDPNATLGPLDPQLMGPNGVYLPAPSILKAVEAKGREKADDLTLVLADVAKKAVKQMKELIIELLEGKVDREKAEKVAERLAGGYYTHDYPITVKELKEMGLKVSTEVPPEIYRLMELYPQARPARPAVEYLPYPHAPPTWRGRPGGAHGKLTFYL